MQITNQTTLTQIHDALGNAPAGKHVRFDQSNQLHVHNKFKLSGLGSEAAVARDNKHQAAAAKIKEAINNEHPGSADRIFNKVGIKQNQAVSVEQLGQIKQLIDAEKREDVTINNISRDATNELRDSAKSKNENNGYVNQVAGRLASLPTTRSSLKMTFLSHAITQYKLANPNDTATIQKLLDVGVNQGVLTGQQKENQLAMYQVKSSASSLALDRKDRAQLELTANASSIANNLQKLPGNPAADQLGKQFVALAKKISTGTGEPRTLARQMAGLVARAELLARGVDLGKLPQAANPVEKAILKNYLGDDLGQVNKLLGNPRSREVLRAFVDRTFSGENLAFYEQVDDLLNSGYSDTQFEQHARKLVKDYELTTTGNDLVVNLPFEQVEAIKSSLDPQFNRDGFIKAIGVAQADAFSLLKNDSHPKLHSFWT